MFITEQYFYILKDVPLSQGKKKIIKAIESVSMMFFNMQGTRQVAATPLKKMKSGDLH
jgi:hypothetical protein